MSHKNFTHPKVCPLGVNFNGGASQSAVCMYTVLPHQFLIVLWPMVPFSGYCRLSQEDQSTTSPYAKRAEILPEIYKNYPDGRSCVQSCGQDVCEAVSKRRLERKKKNKVRTVILRPEREMSSTNDILEEKPDD